MWHQYVARFKESNPEFPRNLLPRGGVPRSEVVINGSEPPYQRENKSFIIIIYGLQNPSLTPSTSQGPSSLCCIISQLHQSIYLKQTTKIFIGGKCVNHSAIYNSVAFSFFGI
jgi:hypothetical protein